MSFQLPPAKLPSFNVPTVRGLPTIPTVGTISGSATTIVGEQFGNLPDIQALPHVKALQKVITEQIGMLIEGKLPTIARAPLYDVRQLRLVAELAQIVAMAASVVAQVQAEIDAGIQAANAKIADINAAKNAILQTPANVRSTVQNKALGRYNEYIGEVNQQKSRLQTALGSL